MSSSLTKITSPLMGGLGMSALHHTLTPEQDVSYLNNIMNYYQNLDTSLADSVVNNLSNAGVDLSQNLTDRISSVMGDETARQEAILANFNAYQELMRPTFETQTNDLHTRLLNQGLGVGNEAYQQAMNDLNQTQNLALNQAAYNAVNLGNEAYNDSIELALKNANLNNNVRNSEIAELYKLMGITTSDEERQNKLYNLGAEKSEIEYNNEMDNIQNLMELLRIASSIATKK